MPLLLSCGCVLGKQRMQLHKSQNPQPARHNPPSCHPTRGAAPTPASSFPPRAIPSGRLSPGDQRGAPPLVLSSSRRSALLSATVGAVLLGNSEFQPAAAAPPRPSVESPPLSASPSATQGALRNSSTAIQALRDPALNHGLATSLERREELGITSLLPAGSADLELEVDRALKAVRATGGGLAAYQQLVLLRSTNEAAFFALLEAHPSEMLPLVYTPTVGDACLHWGDLLLRPAGLYISARDAGRVAQRLASWPADDVSIAVVTDGERILGLGDLGAHGMGISVGKGMLYTVAGGVPPSQVLPIGLDMGCNVEAFRDDPFYVGLRQPRVRGEQYDALVDELVAALRDRYGSATLLHLEDFGGKNAFRLLEKYRKKELLPTFNDDIQSTAAAVLAALLGAVRIQGVPPLRKQTLLFYGAGQANIGAAKLFVAALVREAGLSEEEAKERVWMMDSKGLLHVGRKDLSTQKADFARAAALPPELEGAAGRSLEAVVREVRPTSLVGAASVAGAFTQEVVERLTVGVQQAGSRLTRPVVMALSNPLTRAECTAEEALKWSGGAAVFASGTQFGPVKRRGGEDVLPSQANNSFIFPGIGMGCLASGAIRVTDDMFYVAASAVAGATSEAELRRGSVLPSMERIREVTEAVAARVAEEAVTSMLASASPHGALPCLQQNVAPGASEDSAGAYGCIRGLEYSPFNTTN
eukprot:CAMPEP_0117655880 /NCGR_PEP_ID=MMETSP0804-20121206/4511_1 /TAXON_ID=1074897 /ORGANISM="Tetraselmis astigmatica, Strain CCMP880" /LENGTH=701 /DNA_ID=CAMNT_0005462253 /DNA_START=74 /DNA_END=2179 /DNA_ORIENTATION=+